jgi:hypothetical protein
MYKCSGCSYNSDKKDNVKKHINKKNKCSENIETIVILDTNIFCKFCGKKSTNKYNLERHLKICELKKENLEAENIKLKEEIKILKALNEKPNVTIGTQNNQFNGTQNNQINIQLTPWNNPMIPDNVEKYYDEALKKLFLSVPTLIKYIHFNSELPQNHNICIKNARSGIAKVYNGKEWESMDEKEVINSLITDYESTLMDYAEENNPKYIEKINEIKERDGEENVYGDMHGEIKKTIHDKNHMIKIKN